MTKEEERREKAKNLRYKKAIVQNLSLETIDFDTMEMQDACYDVQWADQNQLLEDLLGEDEACEFKTLFSCLENDLERFRDDLQNEYIPECYEDFMVAVAGKNGQGFDLLGYDSYEEDYFGIDIGYETELAMKESAKRLKRMTKDELIENAQRCFLIAFSYIGIRNRFNELQASIDVLRGETKGVLQMIDRINEAHEKAYGDEYEKKRKLGFRWETDEQRAFDTLLNQFDPYDRIWIE